MNAGMEFFEEMYAARLKRNASVCVFYYCRTYYKAVRVGGGRIVEDMCYERRQAEACVD
jgi:hypothetical protein